MQKIFHFAHLKPTFSILHTYFYKIPTSVCLLYTFIHFFNTLNNRERREKGKESEVKRGERKKRIKKSFTRWTVTVYIYTVIVHLQDHCVYLDIFTKIDVEDFWVNMCKIEHFLYFRRLSVGAEVQNSYVLGLGLTRVQINKYWILILIREPELLRRYEWEIKDY